VLAAASGSVIIILGLGTMGLAAALLAPVLVVAVAVLLLAAMGYTGWRLWRLLAHSGHSSGWGLGVGVATTSPGVSGANTALVENGVIVTTASNTVSPTGITGSSRRCFHVERGGRKPGQPRIDRVRWGSQMRRDLTGATADAADRSFGVMPGWGSARRRSRPRTRLTNDPGGASFLGRFVWAQSAPGSDGRRCPALRPRAHPA
jgi:hypothetical protein